MLQSSPTRRLLSGVVAALLIWLTSLDGAACYFLECLEGGCEAMASVEKPSCCTLTQNVSDGATARGSVVAPPASVPARGAACPVLVTSYGHSESARFDTPADDAAPPVDAGPEVAPGSGDAPPTWPPPRLPDRGDTYLRCRILLI